MITGTCDQCGGNLATEGVLWCLENQQVNFMTGEVESCPACMTVGVAVKW